MAQRTDNSLLALALLCVCGGCAPSPIKPVALSPGDTIAFVAPAGKLDQTRMELARDRLEELGFRVQVPDDLYRERGYLAGPDEIRAAELMAAFSDPNVKAIFPGTGNYGTTRILDLLDYDTIRHNPKVLIGFSDITALHLAVHQKSGLITFHSPNPMWGLGSPGNLTEFSAEYFWRAILAERRTAGGDGYSIECHDVSPMRTLSPGRARGRLTGGNLSLIIALMGTPYEIDTKDRILFLEDVGERPYRIDRYLSQLRLAGKLNEAAGIVLGVFSDCDPNPGEESLTLDEVFEDYFAGLGKPVIANFPAGHTRNNATLPIGVMVEVDADTLQVRILENPTK